MSASSSSHPAATAPATLFHHESATSLLADYENQVQQRQLHRRWTLSSAPAWAVTPRRSGSIVALPPRAQSADNCTSAYTKFDDSEGKVRLSGSELGDELKPRRGSSITSKSSTGSSVKRKLKRALVKCVPCVRNKGNTSASGSRPEELVSLGVALDIWDVCGPDGSFVLLRNTDMVKPCILSLMENAGASDTDLLAVDEFFVKKNPKEQNLFEQIMKPYDVLVGNDQVPAVSFFYYWRALSHVWHSWRDLRGQDGVFLELESMRDDVIRLYESTDGIMPPYEVIRIVRKQVEMSECPHFWHSVREVIPTNPMDIDALFSAMQPLLRRIVDVKGQFVLAENDPLHERVGPEVRVHVYHVTQDVKWIRGINRITASRVSPLKFGGIFHAGVEVAGLEWSYGFTDSDTHPGLACCQPKQHPMHTYRQTFELGRSDLTSEDVAELLSVLMEEWNGKEYDLLRRNCCHFADEFCRRLGVGSIPRWIHRFAWIGEKMDDAAWTFKTGLSKLFTGSNTPDLDEQEQEQGFMGNVLSTSQVSAQPSSSRPRPRPRPDQMIQPVRPYPEGSSSSGPPRLVSPEYRQMSADVAFPSSAPFVMHQTPSGRTFRNRRTAGENQLDQAPRGYPTTRTTSAPVGVPPVGLPLDKEKKAKKEKKEKKEKKKKSKRDSLDSNSISVTSSSTLSEAAHAAGPAATSRRVYRYLSRTASSLDSCSLNNQENIPISNVPRVPHRRSNIIYPSQSRTKSSELTEFRADESNQSSFSSSSSNNNSTSSSNPNACCSEPDSDVSSVIPLENFYSYVNID